MTVDHLKMLHTAGGKGMPLQFWLGLCVLGGAVEGAASAVWDWCSPRLLLLWGWGESEQCVVASPCTFNSTSAPGSWAVSSSPQPSSN